MKSHPVLVALTIVNLGLLSYQVVRPRLALARDAEPVLRGRALEIVDDQGRIRAAIKVLPMDPAQKRPDGQPYPETVILRLIDPNGRPSVKLTASVRGAALGLGGESDPTYARIAADGAETHLSLKNRKGEETLLTR
ncbi:MAG: hypothetical protein AB7I30_17610 [Isosphaeraceae bacterium]